MERSEVLSLIDNLKEYIDRIEEESYRRGYSHGFHNARRRPDVSEKEVMDWVRNIENDEYKNPPGSYL